MGVSRSGFLSVYRVNPRVKEPTKMMVVIQSKIKEPRTPIKQDL